MTVLVLADSLEIVDSQMQPHQLDCVDTLPPVGFLGVLEISLELLEKTSEMQLSQLRYLECSHHGFDGWLLRPRWGRAVWLPAGSAEQVSLGNEISDPC